MAPDRCILCSVEQPVLLKRYSVGEISSRWLADLKIDVSEEFAPNDSFSLYQCDHCGLDFFYPLIAASERFYNGLQKYNWYYMGDKWEFKTALQDIKPGSHVLEVGCGTGAFIRLAGVRDVRVEGIELNYQAVRQAKAENLSVSNQDLFELAEASPGAFDVVCSFQVLEHVPDPLGFLNACVELLRPGGFMLVSVPNNNSFIRYDAADLLNQPPHHLTRWSPRSLGYLSSLLPLKVVRMKKEPLASYHREWYVSAQKCRVPNYIPFSGAVQRSLGAILSKVIEPNELARRITGHTIYVCYSKSGQ